MRIELDSNCLPCAAGRNRGYAKPTKEAVRDWLHRVIASRSPPPDGQAIRDELWKTRT
jgi:hypothetical protein